MPWRSRRISLSETKHKALWLRERIASEINLASLPLMLKGPQGNLMSEFLLLDLERLRKDTGNSSSQLRLFVSLSHRLVGQGISCSKNCKHLAQEPLKRVHRSFSLPLSHVANLRFAASRVRLCFFR